MAQSGSVLVNKRERRTTARFADLPARLRPHVLAFGFTGAVCAAALYWLLQLGSSDLRVPLYYFQHNDLSITGAWVKTLGEHGWLLTNPRLGAPGTLEFFDFPLTDTLHFLFMKALFLFWRDWGAVLNVYYLLGFLLAAWSALAVLRQLGLSYICAIPGSILFAFSPYHFYRGEAHLTLSSYYLVPLAALVMIWTLNGFPLWHHGGRHWWSIRLTRRGIAALVICALVACGGIYYTFFAVLLLAAAGVRAMFAHGVRAAAAPFVLIAAIVIVIAFQLAPNLLYYSSQGVNSEVASRPPQSAEVYGLKIAQLLLPATGHRIPILAEIRQKYRATSISVNENDGSALGAFGAAGFVILIGTALFGARGFRHSELLAALGLLALVAVLIGTMGGFGSIFSYLVSSKIRAYNRISIYIQFFSIAAAVAALDILWSRTGRNMSLRLSGGAAIGVILIAGILDQTSTFPRVHHEDASAQFARDEAFIRSIESLMPAGASILQLPNMRFPESSPIHNMLDYEHLRAYLHSHTLRWSYGSMRGRFWDAWLTDLASRPGRQMIERAVMAGFEGVLINRDGYPDGGANLERELAAISAAAPLRSQDSKLAFYDLRPFSRELRGRFTPAEWSRLQRAVLDLIVVKWTGGFSRLERSESTTWRWCGRSGELVIENSSAETLGLQMNGLIISGTPDASTVTMQGPGIEARFKLVDRRPAELNQTVRVRPGRTVIRFSSDGPRAPAPGDPRYLVFQIRDLVLSRADGPARAAGGDAASAGLVVPGVLQID